MHLDRNEWARYYRRRELDDLQILHAKFVNHAFARHSHDYFVVGYVEAGTPSASATRIKVISRIVSSVCWEFHPRNTGEGTDLPCSHYCRV